VRAVVVVVCALVVVVVATGPCTGVVYAHALTPAQAG
jgi:hypothetical protein